jgi:hypothetical protein
MPGKAPESNGRTRHASDHLEQVQREQIEAMRSQFQLAQRGQKQELDALAPRLPNSSNLTLLRPDCPKDAVPRSHRNGCHSRPVNGHGQSDKRQAKSWLRSP